MRDELKVYVLMRRDLRMTRGKECSQAAHAVLGLILPRVHKPPTLDWRRSGGAKIFLSVDDEDHLLRFVKEARAAGEHVYVVKDAGRTMFDGVPTITCAAIGPTWASRAQPLFGELKLR